MKRTIAIAFILAAVTLTGCKKYLDVNQNPNALDDASEALLLSPLEAAVSGNIASGNAAVLVNGWMQNVAQNQPAPNTFTYQVTNSNFDDYWSSFYVTTLNNLEILNKKATADSNSIYAGIARVLIAYTLGNATDLWGDIPYSQAFKGTANTTPAYDKQSAVYTAIQGLLDTAILNLNAAKGLTPGTDDFLYGGDAGKWIKMAYTLKARYYMHLTKAPGHTASDQATLALAALAHGMQSNADDCMFTYTGTSTTESPWYQNLFSTTTAVLNSTLLDTLQARNDPRLNYQYLADTALNTGQYTGRTDGTDVGVLENYSRIGNFYGAVNANNYVLNYSEAVFLKAEATYYTSGYLAAVPIHRQGIASHFLKLGIDTASSAAQAFLTARGTLTAGNAIQRIMEEKSIANFLSTENYVDFRRTGYPSVSLVTNASTSAVPRRFLYPLDEVTSNPQPQQSAKLTDRVWWDAQ
jgi:hypothetical protein